uniref:Uncharacterized protein n=1 Tax=Chelonoidis abingdonii TaxID=106734 RepID=A0A8C0JHI7_CHEAB
CHSHTTPEWVTHVCTHTLYGTHKHTLPVGDGTHILHGSCVHIHISWDIHTDTHPPPHGTHTHILRGTHTHTYTLHGTHTHTYIHIAWDTDTPPIGAHTHTHHRMGMHTHTHIHTPRMGAHIHTDTHKNPAKDT